jgi:hypothetical protein
MSDTWEFYFTHVNDKIASIFVNVGIQADAPDETLPCLNWVFLYMNRPRDDGLSSSDEVPEIQTIEDTLIERMRNDLGAVHAGRITTNGRRELYFYAPQADGFELISSSVCSSFPSYRFDHGSKVDKQWSHYQNVLYPSAEDFQRISNRHVIESLERHGDLLKKQRSVDHWAYFSSADDRSRFADKVREAGFNIVQTYEIENPADSKPLVVQFERVDQVDWNSINVLTLELFHLARSTNGDYDGWETSVEKDVE